MRIELELLSIDPPGMGGGDAIFHFEVHSTGSYGGAVPEPASAMLLAVGALWPAWERGGGGERRFSLHTVELVVSDPQEPGKPG